MSSSYPVSQSWNFSVVGGKQCYRLSPSSDLSYKLIHTEAMRLPFLHRWSKLDLPFTTFFFFNLPTYLRMYSIGLERLFSPLLLHSIQFYELPQFLGEVSSER